MTEAAIKYPLACGCAGPKYISKCVPHQVIEMDEHRARLGIPDLTYKPEDLDTDQGRDTFFRLIRGHQKAFPGRAIKIHILAPSA